jgi:hypothetical protein
VIHLIFHWLGLDNASGPLYLAWSGAGADFGELAIVGGLLSIYRRHNCSQRHCWRVGRRQLHDTGLHLCHRHHPDGAKPTGAHILALHRAHVLDVSGETRERLSPRKDT